MLGALPSMFRLPRRGQTDTTGDRGTNVGDDVAEHVVGHDDVESSRIGHEEDSGRVDVAVVDSDLREVDRDAVDDPLVQTPGVNQHVRLVHEWSTSYVVALRLARRLPERVAALQTRC